MSAFLSNAWPCATLGFVAAALFSRGDASGFVAGSITVTFPLVLLVGLNERVNPRVLSRAEL